MGEGNESEVRNSGHHGRHRVSRHGRGRLKCTSVAQSAWMSQDATKDLLKQQGYQEVRKIKVTEGNCYEVYAIDAQGDKVEVYLDPTNGSLVAKED